MTRICALLLCLFSAGYLYAGPQEDAIRVARYHDRLQAVGVGGETSIRVLLRDGETLKGTIDYLHSNEVGIRDAFGDLRPVPLAGIVDFAAHNQVTGAKVASSNVLRRTAHLLLRHMSGTGFV